MELLTVGQRFISETEPELGLGILTVIEAKTITVFYPASDTTRKYGIKSAPLKRARFGVGDIISSVDNLTIEVEHITPFEGLIIYRGTDGQEILESELTGALSYSKPEERLFNGLIDSNELFKLRFETHLLHKQTLLSPVRGFIGGRISLISHQLYLAQEVAKRPIPRALLADEVGLGKTIEAGLILHHLYKTGRIERVLILVPDSLVHQWFVEMLRRFQIAFCVINQETHFDPEINPFKYHQLVICNMGLFKGSKVAQNLLEQAQWDMLIVDEAHQLSWSEELVSFEYELVQKIASKSLGLILLTATPEQLGQSGHFARLKLLDPHRFNNYQQFLAENEDYEKVAKKGLVLVENNCSATDDQARSKLQHLLDIHGTGRVFFRNTRNTMEKTFHFFPKRILNSYALLTDKAATVIRGNQERAGSTTFNLRMDWLVQFLHKHLGQKVLLISTSKDKIISIEKALRHRTSKVVASVFHSGLTLMARDRQVAYFAEPGGADLLLCTEVGSEGRNFEFVSHLVLFDLPLNPDLLEQRIGRLDRIGQKRDIHIHVPYIQNSYEEILFHWYHEGLDAFNAPVKGAQALLEQVGDQLNHCLDHSKDYLASGSDKLNKFLNEARSINKQLEDKLEKGRDRLIEMASFDQQIAKKIVDEIKQIDSSNQLKEYMDKVFHHFGVHSNDLDATSIYLCPTDNMFVPHFPHLPKDGLSVTYNRQKALEREDLKFITWDHPMVYDTFELILGHEFGNATIASWADENMSQFLLESIYILKVVAPQALEASRHFPPTILRVVVDQLGNNMSARFKLDELNAQLINAKKDKIEQVKEIPKHIMNDLLKKSYKYIEHKIEDVKNRYLKATTDEFDREIKRLEDLQKKELVVDPQEIILLQDNKAKVLQTISEARIHLDSLRLVV